MKNVEEQKKKLEQKKNRLSAEETKLKLKERKARTRHLIEIGGLIVKADLDYLPTNTLYGALLSLSTSLKQNPSIQDTWTEIGKDQFDREDRQTSPVILTFPEEPIKEIKDKVRSLGLRFNRFRSEWYGNVTNLDELKNSLQNQQHQIEILNHK